MVLPQWNQVGVNFSGSGQSMANATRSIGNVGDIANAMINQKNKEDELALRNQQLQMQQAAEDRAAEQFGILKNEKVAANEYAKALRGATDGNVVSVQDQAKLAAISQDQSLTPEQRANVIGNVLPAMTKRYEASPDSQLQVLRSVTAPANVNPATGMALLKEAEQPIEKLQALNAAHAAKLEEEKIKAAERVQQQQMLYGLQLGIKNAEIAGRREEAKLNRDNQIALKEREYNAPTYTAEVDGANKVLSPNQLMEAQKAGSTITNLTKIGTSNGDGSGGSGSGGGTGKKGGVLPEGAIETAGGVVVGPQGILGFTGDQRETAKIADKLVTDKTYTKEEVQRAVNTQQTLDWDAGLTINNIDRVLPPKKLKDGNVIPASVALQLPDMLGKKMYSDNNGKLRFTEGNKELTSEDIEKLGFKKVLKKDDKGATVSTFMPAPDYDVFTGIGPIPDFGVQDESRTPGYRPYVLQMYDDAKSEAQAWQNALRDKNPNSLLKFSK